MELNLRGQLRAGYTKTRGVRVVHRDLRTPRGGSIAEALDRPLRAGPASRWCAPSVGRCRLPSLLLHSVTWAPAHADRV